VKVTPKSAVKTSEKLKLAFMNKIAEKGHKNLFREKIHEKNVQNVRP
jgi:hypothetical protein